MKGLRGAEEEESLTASYSQSNTSSLCNKESKINGNVHSQDPTPIPPPMEINLYFLYFRTLRLIKLQLCCTCLLYEGVIYSACITLLFSFYLCYFMKASSTLLLSYFAALIFLCFFMKASSTLLVLLCFTNFTCLTS